MNTYTMWFIEDESNYTYKQVLQWLLFAHEQLLVLTSDHKKNTILDTFFIIFKV